MKTIALRRAPTRPVIDGRDLMREVPRRNWIEQLLLPTAGDWFERHPYLTAGLVLSLVCLGGAF